MGWGGGGGQDEVGMGVCLGMGVVKVLWKMVVDGSSCGSMGGDDNSGGGREGRMVVVAKVLLWGNRASQRRLDPGKETLEGFFQVLNQKEYQNLVIISFVHLEKMNIFCFMH